MKAAGRFIRRAFSADTVSDTLAGVLEHEPGWEALPETTPALARSLLRRCLTKKPQQRLRDIGDARIELEDPDVDVTYHTSVKEEQQLNTTNFGYGYGGLASVAASHDAATSARRA